MPTSLLSNFLGDKGFILDEFEEFIFEAFKDAV